MSSDIKNRGGRCLFSAPYGFLPEKVLASYESIMPCDFRVAWTPGDLEPSPAVVVWVPNPGQNFIIDEVALADFPNLEVVSTPSTGTNHVDGRACERYGVAVYSLLDDRETLERISASAEFTFLLILNTLRRLDLAMHEVSTGRWRGREDTLRGAELAGKQVGIVGLGRIGRRLVKWLRAFDARIAFYDPFVPEADVPAWSLERIFSDSDVVCVCCSLTPETVGMIGRSLLERLRPGASLVNTSRGEVIREEDLAALLEARQDLRVGLDVLAGEVSGEHLSSPLLPFHRSGQVVITPHIAGATIESQTKAAQGALANISRHYAGAQP